MKWSTGQLSKLKELCYAGVSNKEIAAQLNCKITDVYSKRSQMGITIDRCKAVEPKKPIIKKRVISNEVKQAFLILYNAIAKEIENKGK